MQTPVNRFKAAIAADQPQIGLWLGLADAYGSLDSVARDVVKAEKLIDYTSKENIAERVAKRLGAAIGQGAVSALRSVSVR